MTEAPMIDDTLSEALVGAVRDVARAEILPRFRRLSGEEIDTKSGPDDLVTVADRAAEEALGERVARLLPEALFLGEEAISTDPSLLDGLDEADLAVIVDPVDGTWNFARGLALFAVMLAVVARGETVFGLIYDPVLDDWMLARPGQGAWACRPDAAPRRLRSAPEKPEAEETGYLPTGLFTMPARERLLPLYLTHRRVQNLRCSAHEYRLMIDGHADWMVTHSSNPWDHLAGRLCLTEAGGAIAQVGAVPWRVGDTSRVLLAARSEARLGLLEEQLSEVFDQ
ncbi:inositol monophosphatase family protein [Palleronia caenipelagi]|uniref:Inositol monophosphatase n=1 Tax=Palleronia caenipelagi TaxID=2489174 RepID=A0A547Q737_9RHOB|nr:inositol monophosphatase [Palleronia caenipelagi]TRD22200.1 inositol monophosphatase [Palleronia caenipelagi]